MPVSGRMVGDAVVEVVSVIASSVGFWVTVLVAATDIVLVAVGVVVSSTTTAQVQSVSVLQADFLHLPDVESQVRPSEHVALVEQLSLHPTTVVQDAVAAHSFVVALPQESVQVVTVDAASPHAVGQSGSQDTTPDGVHDALTFPITLQPSAPLYTGSAAIGSLSGAVGATACRDDNCVAT